MVANKLVHAVVPLLYVVYWLLFATRGGTRWGSTFGWLLHPLLYFIYTFLHGWVTHFIGQMLAMILNAIARGLSLQYYPPCSIAGTLLLQIV